MAQFDGTIGKGKGKALPEDELKEHEEESSDSGSDSDSTDSDKSSESDFDEITPEYLESLLDKARKNIALKKSAQNVSPEREDEGVIKLDVDVPTEPVLPPLDPGPMPPPYFELSRDRKKGPLAIRDPDVEQAERAFSSRYVPSEPIPPPELNKSGKPLTKKELKALKKKEAGLGWFDLPTPSEADLPRLHREVEALRLRNRLDPKRFYRKEEGEGKGIKGLPKQFAIGTIIPTSTPFGTQSSDNLPKASRKRTIVDELVDDAEAKAYAKKKFKELQTVRGAKGRNTLRKKKELRQSKW